MIQGGPHVDRVPEHDHVGDQAEGAQLVFLALSVRPSYFVALAVADGPAHAMAVLAAVDQYEDTPAIDRVVDIVEQVDGPVDASDVP